MTGNGNVFVVYLAYVTVAVTLTAWLARTLFRNGTEFLHDVFKERPGLADALNHLLVVGFYMVNMGYALWVLRAGEGLGAFASLQFLLNRLAILLLSLGALHFANVLVFWRIRSHREQRVLPPPLVPHVVVPPPPPVVQG